MITYRSNLASRGTPQPYVVPLECEEPSTSEPPQRNRRGRPPKARPAKDWNYTAPILLEVERWLKRNGIAAAKFGMLALGDPGLVFNLRAGRDPSSKTVARIRAFMQEEG